MKRMMMVTAALALVSLACSGASEERVGVVESHLKTLDRNAAKKLHEHQQRLEALEKAVSGQHEVLTALKEKSGRMDPQTSSRLTSVEQTLAEIQKKLAFDVQSLQAKIDKSSKKTPKVVTVAPKKEEFPEYLVATFLGATGKGFTREGQDYEVSKQWLLLQIRAVTGGAASPRFSEDKRRGGVKAMRVSPKSVLGQLGLRNGDVILEFNDKVVSSPSELYEQVKAVSGDTVKVFLQRKQKEMTFTYKLID